MKYTVIVAAVTALLGSTSVFASPTERAKRGCGAPGTYRCAASLATMEVCDWDGAWKPLNPGCPSGTACEENPFGNGIPYCIATPVTPPVTPTGGSCSVQAQYSCFTDSAGKPGIQICDLSNTLKVVGMCPDHCAYIAGIPYCF